MEHQRKIAESGDVLSQTLEQSKNNVRDMMAELRASTREQRNMIFSVIDHVSKLQSLFLSEVSWVYTLLFYSGCAITVYLATATKRTGEARLWLFLVLCLNFIAERWVSSLTIGSLTNMASESPNYGKNMTSLSSNLICCDFNSSQLRRCEFGSQRDYFSAMIQ